MIEFLRPIIINPQQPDQTDREIGGSLCRRNSLFDDKLSRTAVDNDLRLASGRFIQGVPARIREYLEDLGWKAYLLSEPDDLPQAKKNTGYKGFYGVCMSNEKIIYSCASTWENGERRRAYSPFGLDILPGVLAHEAGHACEYIKTTETGEMFNVAHSSNFKASVDQDIEAAGGAQILFIMEPTKESPFAHYGELFANGMAHHWGLPGIPPLIMEMHFPRTLAFLNDFLSVDPSDWLDRYGGFEKRSPRNDKPFGGRRSANWRSQTAAKLGLA